MQGVVLRRRLLAIARMARKSLLSALLSTSAFAGQTEPDPWVCDDPPTGLSESLSLARAMEEAVSPAAVESAYEAIVYFPRRPPTDKRSTPISAIEKSNEAGVVYAGVLMERAHRRRVEWELSKMRGEAAGEMSQKRASYEKAQAQFCTFMGHALLPELRPDLYKEKRPAKDRFED